MAEVRKGKKVKKYDITDKLDSKNNASKKEKRVNVKDDKEKEEVKKANLWVRFRIFCHGVASEFRKVHWPTRQHMVKYSIATICFVIFLAVFFYLIDIIFALIRTLIG